MPVSPNEGSVAPVASVPVIPTKVCMPSLLIHPNQEHGLFLSDSTTEAWPLQLHV